MHAILPCSRIIWILRNPLARAFSEYMHQAVKKNKYPLFKTLLEAEIKAIKSCSRQELSFASGFNNQLFNCLEKFRLQKYMLSTGFYPYFIHAWLEKFPFEQHLFLNYDNFKNDPNITLREISDFLNLSPHPTLEKIWKYNKANTNDGKAAQIRRKNMNIPKKLLKDVETYVKPHVRELYRVIRQDFQWNLQAIL